CLCPVVGLSTLCLLLLVTCAALSVLCKYKLLKLKVQISQSKLLETKCYYFSSRMLSWSSSRAWCRTQGGDLLIINSEQEQNFIFDTSRALEQSITRLWIGMTDAEEEDDWRWVDGSKVNSDVYWLSRPGMATEPDDWKLDDPLGEDCGHVDTSENALKSWMDGSCKKPYRWICEKNI
uniref:C-type lectin domain-containing protein n=1 Tax=Seriola dumerili TaxID=41447 RepID=A0A3B4TPA2_SERDU